MKRALVLIFVFIALWCSPVLAQEGSGANDTVLPPKVLVSYAIYEGDCDLADDDLRFLAWRRTSTEAEQTDEEIAKYAQFRYEWVLETYSQDSLKPTNEQTCAYNDHSYQVHLSIRVHRGALEGGTCATWTDKQYICTKCGAKYTEQTLDKQTHPYREFTCRMWVPSLTTGSVGSLVVSGEDD